MKTLFKKRSDETLIDLIANSTEEDVFEISEKELELIIKANHYRKTGSEQYYSELNNYDLPNLFVISKFCDRIYVKIRAWVTDLPEHVFSHSIEVIIKYMIPLAHRTNGPAFILNKENFNATYNMKAIFYVQNGVLHSENSPAIFSDGHIAFYFFGKNKTAEFKEAINLKKYYDIRFYSDHFCCDDKKASFFMSEDIIHKWQIFTQDDSFMTKIKKTRKTEEHEISDDVLIFFYEHFEDTLHHYHSLVSKDNLYDLPNLIVKHKGSGKIQKIWRNSNNENHRNPDKPAVIIYEEDRIEENYFINGININNFVTERKEYENISDIFEP